MNLRDFGKVNERKRHMKETHKYDDIIGIEYPFENEAMSKHQRMSIEDRAKIFASFAALRGYEDSVEDRQFMVEEESKKEYE